MRLMQFHGLFHEERVIHAKPFERHVRVDADGVTELVGEEIPVLEPDLVGFAFHMQVMPTIDVVATRLVHNGALLLRKFCHDRSFVPRLRYALPIEPEKMPTAPFQSRHNTLQALWKNPEIHALTQKM